MCACVRVCVRARGGMACHRAIRGRESAVGVWNGPSHLPMQPSARAVDLVNGDDLPSCLARDQLDAFREGLQHVDRQVQHLRQMPRDQSGCGIYLSECRRRAEL